MKYVLVLMLSYVAAQNTVDPETLETTETPTKDTGGLFASFPGKFSAVLSPKDDAHKQDNFDETLEDGSSDEEINLATKKIAFLGNLSPSQFFNPINKKIAEISAALTHPNGLVLPRPSDLWSRIQETFNGANSAIFGLGQGGGQDYPFPYRTANARSNLLQDKLQGYKEPHAILADRKDGGLAGAYIFPFLIGSDSIYEFVKNLTANRVPRA